MRRFLTLLFATAALFACESEGDLKSNDIVADIPWSVPESQTYRVLDDDDDEVGTLELSIDEESDGRVRMHQFFDFPDAGFVNEAIVIADDSELQPVSATFRIEGPDGNLECEAEYSGNTATIHRVGEDDERTDELDVPQIAYDSWSDLFLWRTIEFTEGREYEYTDILSCTLARAQRLGLKLKVEGPEEVEVPAGTYEAWRLEIEGGERDQKAWFTTDDERRLVKYDNGRETFELLAIKPAR